MYSSFAFAHGPFLQDGLRLLPAGAHRQQHDRLEHRPRHHPGRHHHHLLHADRRHRGRDLGATCCRASFSGSASSSASGYLLFLPAGGPRRCAPPSPGQPQDQPRQHRAPTCASPPSWCCRSTASSTTCRNTPPTRPSCSATWSRQVGPRRSARHRARRAAVRAGLDALHADRQAAAGPSTASPARSFPPTSPRPTRSFPTSS